VSPRALAVVAALAIGAAYGHTGSHPPGKIDYSKAEDTPFGKAADPTKATRTIRIDMADTMRYTPAEISVKRGETVRFVAKNGGKVMHEMVLGTKEELARHAEDMKKSWCPVISRPAWWAGST
jgi:uncharacterized cupredoxin-like copper-binding protein